MITRIIVALTLSVMSATFLFVDCSKNNSGSGKLSAEESALLSEIESAEAQSTPESSQESLPESTSTQQSTSAAASTSTQQSTSAPAPKSTPKSSAVVEIREKMFIAQTNDVYINKDDYLGKTIKYEGLFDQSDWRGNGKTYYYVIRLGPGCCPGDAAAAGFEVLWDGDNSGKRYPKKNDWVEATGVLHEYDDDGIPSLRLALTSLKVLSKRGKERVTQ